MALLLIDVAVQDPVWRTVVAGGKTLAAAVRGGPASSRPREI
jgi:hypothetical protein